MSSSCSSSSCDILLPDGNDGLFGLAADGDEVVRFKPNAAIALFLLGLVMRDERAGVVWKDMLRGSLFQSSWQPYSKLQDARGCSQGMESLSVTVARVRLESL